MNFHVLIFEIELANVLLIELCELTFSGEAWNLASYFEFDFVIPYFIYYVRLSDD